MKKNVMKFAAVAALTVALSACKKSESDDDTVTLALLYLVDQTSGNCVTITKNDAAHSGAAGAGDGKPTYTATGTTRPKAACGGAYNVVAIINDVEAVVTSVKAGYQAAKDKADAAGDNCKGANQTSSSLQTTIDAVTALKVQQSIAASTGNSCLALGTGWNLSPLNFGGASISVDPNPAYFGKTVYACSSEEAKTLLLASFKLNTTTLAGSVATDMATDLAFKQKTAAVTASNFKWTADAAAKGRLINVTELTTAGKSGAALIAFTTAAAINNQLVNGGGGATAAAAAARACAKAILANESAEAQGIAAALHNNDPAALTFFAGAATGNFTTGDIITTAQAESVKEVLFSSLQCKYGDFDEEAAGNKTTVGTETNVKNIGTCPAIYPKI
ncbi:lipoprotein LipL36 [Leptospira borgpetersenii]|uniref:lipoprotein LipL36 n=1 Tax=Leptospira borgpetersenii TaxID=174 RepID=UPI000773CC51|nr:lipoprotein LipL36 [Leptospira borgpetersenii]